MMTVIPSDRFFYPILTQKMEFFLLTIEYAEMLDDDLTEFEITMMSLNKLTIMFQFSSNTTNEKPAHERLGNIIWVRQEFLFQAQI